MIEYKTEKILLEFGNTGNKVKRLTLTSWNRNPATLDLRAWKTDNPGLRPSKGMTLTDSDALLLINALTQYLEDKAAAESNSL